jgi:tetratricopeptide (TPR) repeat protein
MGCITCHNPHVLPTEAEAEKYYRDRCQACHAEHGCSVPIAVRRQTSPTDNCVSCHMPQGGTDITHVALTDHRILRKAESKASTQASSANLSRQDGLLAFHRNKLDVGDDELMRDLGVMLMEQARVQASTERLTAARMALPLLEQAVQRHADDSASRDGLELALGFQEYLQKALSVCEETLRTAPRREWTVTDAAMISQSLGKNEESFAYWKRALEINPWSSRYRHEVATQLAAQREWAKAGAECMRVLKYNGSHIESRMLLVRCLLQRGEKGQARAEMARVLALRPTAAESLQRNIDQLLQELEHAANPGK